MRDDVLTGIISFSIFDTLESEGSLAYENTEIIKNITAAYRFDKKVMEVKELENL
ncbi:hypothetical protein [Cohnella terricola]|uniref:hypothetical protein n=1 Tax=Cohnella terricola TaxID=1289167 RepID=UPI0016495797|nr:hypothetical protein [Cohnella terricola]